MWLTQSYYSVGYPELLFSRLKQVGSALSVPELHHSTMKNSYLSSAIVPQEVTFRLTSAIAIGENLVLDGTWVFSGRRPLPTFQ